MLYLVIFAVDGARNGLRLWEAGHAGPTWSPMIMFIFFAAIVVTALLRRRLDGRAGDET